MELESSEAHEELAAAAAAQEAATDDSPTVRLVRSIISQAIEQGASDLHFDPAGDHMKVRFRVDGMMAEATRIPVRKAARVISRSRSSATSTSPSAACRRTGA